MDEKTQPTNYTGNSTAAKVFIFGSDRCARRVASNLAAWGVQSWMAAGADTPSDPFLREEIRWLSGVRLAGCRGNAGAFRLDLAQGDATFHKEAGAIVIAQDQMTTPNYSPYGLSKQDRVVDISTLEQKLADGSALDMFSNAADIAFLCGWLVDSHPATARRMLRCCLELQGYPQINTLFMTGNLKVSAQGAEALCLGAKKNGTVFAKFTHSFPVIDKGEGGTFTISYDDKLTRTPFETTVHWIVVDETILPHRELMDVARILEIEIDRQGYAQADNVHRLSNATNRRGIFVAGGSRGTLSHEEKLADADQVSMKVLAFLNDEEGQQQPKVEIHRGRCAQCLTCYRLCPHDAIDIGKRISIVRRACHGCGICFAGCPARAIEFEGNPMAGADGSLPRSSSIASRKEASEGRVVVFGCSRSAGQAQHLIQITGCKMPSDVRFIEVPCGGAVSSRHLLAAFDRGAEGVMLLTCHPDNCKAQIGNTMAAKRADMARHTLTAAGVDTDRLFISSLAANMGNEFRQMITGFAQGIKMLTCKE